LPPWFTLPHSDCSVFFGDPCIYLSFPLACAWTLWQGAAQRFRWEVMILTYSMKIIKWIFKQFCRTIAHKSRKNVIITCLIIINTLAGVIVINAAVTHWHFREILWAVEGENNNFYLLKLKIKFLKFKISSVTPNLLPFFNIYRPFMIACFPG